MKNQKTQSTNRHKEKSNKALPVGGSRKTIGILLFILLATFVAYSPSLKNGFVWDDNEYIVNNPLIYFFNLKDIFSTFSMANYHPVTILALAVEFKLFGPSESAFHLVNILIHLGNVILVFFAVKLISKNAIPALIATLLFAIHPMHVESVTWVSGIKDLLYTFFFLSAYIFYLKYLNERKKSFYLYTMILFALSLLSKAMAVSFPVLLILTDYFLGEKIKGRNLINKIPFFALSIIAGIVAIYAQKDMGATDLTVFPIGQRIIFACYGFVTYIIKLAFPFSLSALYGYPMAVGESMPTIFYLYVMLFLALAAYVIISLRHSKKLFFGISFFAINVFLVLQILPVGSAVMADRYSYLPSIGIFYLAGEGCFFLWKKGRKNSLTYAGISLLVIFSVFFTCKTFSQTKIWKDGITLWNSTIEKNPQSPTAYLNRASAYSNKNNFEAAFTDYNKAIDLKPDYAEALNNRAALFIKTTQYERALQDLNKAIQIEPNFPLSYNNRGLIYMYMKKNPEALENYNKSIELSSNITEAFFNRGILFNSENKFQQAIDDFSTVLRLAPTNVDANYYRGLCYVGLGQFDNALRDFSTTIESRPNYLIAYEFRSSLYINEKKYLEALKDFDKMISLSPSAKTYLNRGSVYGELKKYQEAIADYNMAISMQPDLAKAYFNKALVEEKIGMNDSACIHLRQAIELGFQKAVEKRKMLCQ